MFHFINLLFISSVPPLLILPPTPLLSLSVSFPSLPPLSFCLSLFPLSVSFPFNLSAESHSASCFKFVFFFFLFLTFLFSSSHLYISLPASSLSVCLSVCLFLSLSPSPLFSMSYQISSTPSTGPKHLSINLKTTSYRFPIFQWREFKQKSMGVEGGRDRCKYLQSCPYKGDIFVYVRAKSSSVCI